jgi:hypothetical protein
MAPSELLNLMESPDLFPFVWRIGDTMREIEYLHRVSLLTLAAGRKPSPLRKRKERIRSKELPTSEVHETTLT